GRARKQHHLRNRDAGATKDQRQAPVDFLQHDVQMADTLFFAEEIKLPHHHRPDDAVLAAPATKIGYGAQVLGVDFVIIFVRSRQQAEYTFQMVKARHEINYSFHRSSGRQKPSLGVFQSSVGWNNVPGVRRLASMASRLRSTPRPGLSGTIV